MGLRRGTGLDSSSQFCYNWEQKWDSSWRGMWESRKGVVELGGIIASLNAGKNVPGETGKLMMQEQDSSQDSASCLLS